MLKPNEYSDDNCLSILRIYWFDRFFAPVDIIFFHVSLGISMSSANSFASLSSLFPLE